MTTPDMPTDLHAEAVTLIRSLCEVAGNTEDVIGELEALSTETSFDTALQIAASALLVMFAECISHPTPLDAGHVSVPIL